MSSTCDRGSSRGEETGSIPPSVILPAPHTTQTAGRCRLSLDHWKKIAGPWHIKVLTHGIPLDWTNGPPQFTRPFDSAKNLTGRPTDLEACRKTLQHYLDIGSIRALPDQSDTRGVWSAFFPVPKKGTDKVRGCIDLNTINPYLQYEHFKMEGLHTIQAQLRRRDHMWKIDMSDFYMHLLIAEEDRLYFRFQFEGIKYECLAMPLVSQQNSCYRLFDISADGRSDVWLTSTM